MHNIWPFLIRLAIAIYFIYPNTIKLLNAAVSFKNGGIFACVDSYIPSILAYNMWYGAFVALGVLILIWPRPILPLSIALASLVAELYINFGTNKFGLSSILLLVLILISIALIIYYAFHRHRRD
jgi:hypothetical protein